MTGLNNIDLVKRCSLLAVPATTLASFPVWREECLPFDLIHSIQGHGHVHLLCVYTVLSLV